MSMFLTILSKSCCEIGLDHTSRTVHAESFINLEKEGVVRSEFRAEDAWALLVFNVRFSMLH